MSRVFDFFPALPWLTNALLLPCLAFPRFFLLDVGKKAGEAGRRFQETATEATRQMQESAKNANISSPLPDTSAAEDLKKAANLLRGFVDKEENEQGFDNIIPTEVLRRAKSLAIYTVIKAVSPPTGTSQRTKKKISDETEAKKEGLEGT